MPFSIAHFISCFLDWARFLCEKTLDKIIDKYFTVSVVSEGCKRHIVQKKNTCCKENIIVVCKIISFSFARKKYDDLKIDISRFIPKEFILRFCALLVIQYCNYTFQSSVQHFLRQKIHMKYTLRVKRILQKRWLEKWISTLKI